MTTIERPTPADLLGERIADRIVALDALRRFVAEHDLDARLYGDHNSASVWPETREDLAHVVRILKTGAPLGSVTKADAAGHLQVIRDFGAGVTLTAWFARSEVCEAKVVGQRTEMVPDPDAPMVERTLDVIEWECSPILDTSSEAREDDLRTAEAELAAIPVEPF